MYVLVNAAPKPLDVATSHFADAKSRYACADPGIFVRGVQVSLIKESSDNVFFFFS